jgi:hypothetical protein
MAGMPQSETGTDPQAALDRARVMYRAVLAPWASDVLGLRARRLDVPGWRTGVGPVLRPSEDGLDGRGLVRRAA